MAQENRLEFTNLRGPDLRTIRTTKGTQIAMAVVSYNTRSLLEALLAAGAQAGVSETIVVDNASDDGSVEMVRTRFPWVRLLANQTNVGYGAAANQALAATQSDYLVLLNSDVRLAPQAILLLKQFLDENPAVAVAGPRLCNDDGSLQPSCYPFPTLLPLLLRESGLESALGHLPGIRQHYLRAWDHQSERIVPWVLGAVLALRRAPVTAVGGFDEGYFMYAEEIDLCYRLQQRGWRVAFTPATCVTHLGGCSTEQRRTEMKVHYYASLRRFYRQHYRRPAQLLLNLMIVAVLTARLVRDEVRVRSASGAQERQRLAADIQAWRTVLSQSRPALRRGGKQ